MLTDQQKLARPHGRASVATLAQGKKHALLMRFKAIVENKRVGGVLTERLSKIIHYRRTQEPVIAGDRIHVLKAPVLKRSELYSSLRVARAMRRLTKVNGVWGTSSERMMVVKSKKGKRRGPL